MLTKVGIGLLVLWLLALVFSVDIGAVSYILLVVGVILLVVGLVKGKKPAGM